MRVRLNDYELKDIMRFIRETTELNRADFGKTIHRAAKTIKNYELGERNYSAALLKEIAQKHGFTITIEKKDSF